MWRASPKGSSQRLARFAAAAGSVLALLYGIGQWGVPTLLALFALTPDEWQTKLRLWINKISSVMGSIELFWVNCVLLVLLGAVGCIIVRRFSGKSQDIVLTAQQFEEQFETAIRSTQYDHIRIFGYTGETATDYFHYDVRYLEGLKIEILNRDWMCEEREETEHNSRIKELSVRQWDKSGKIRYQAFLPWKHEAVRQVRYYDFMQPFVKAIILSGRSQNKAFVSFYRWEDLPADGGSQFKGANLPMIQICSDHPQSAEIIRNLISQFDLVFSRKSRGLREQLQLEAHY